MVYMILPHLEYNDPYIASIVYSCIVGERCFSLLQVSFLMLLVTKVLEEEAVSASVFVALLTVVDVVSVYGRCLLVKRRHRPGSAHSTWVCCCCWRAAAIPSAPAPTPNRDPDSYHNYYHYYAY